jgi:hypothetical protein
VVSAPLSIYEQNDGGGGDRPEPPAIGDPDPADVQRTGIIVSDAVAAAMAFCTICRIRRPRLSTHCRQCDNCVMGWDHHCNWIGNCVGQRNHRTFVLFLIMTPLWCILVCALASAQLIVEGFGTANSIGVTVLATAMFFCVSLLGMTFMHVSLVMDAQTLKMNTKRGPNNPALTSKQRWTNLANFCLSYGPRPTLCPSRALIREVSALEAV